MNSKLVFSQLLKLNIIDKVIELLFELDFGLYQAYVIHLKNGVIYYEDDAKSDYIPITAIIFESGQKNGLYKPKIKDLENLKQFIHENVITLI
jgi:hypothetical protein